jgi:hypothetical protein
MSSLLATTALSSTVVACLTIAASSRGALAQAVQCVNIKVASQPFCLRVPGTSDRARAVLAPCNGASTDPSLVWRVRPDPHGGFIVNTTLGAVPDRRLEIENWSQEDNAAVQIWGANAFEWSNQKWNFVPTADGSMMANVKSGKCVDVPNWNFASGVPLQQWQCHGGTNQKWSLVQVTPSC